MAAGKAALPADGTVLPSTSQPVTLTVQNAVTTQPSLPVSDTFEIATDSAFAHIVVTKTIPQSAGGQTSVTLDPLPPSTYFWHVRAGAGGAVVISAPGTFRIAAVLLAPAPVLPANGVRIGHLDQPVTLAVQNPTMPATVTVITDTFEVATDAAFTMVVASQTVPQGAGPQTSVTLSPLAGAVTYYWRVQVAATGAIGATTATASFLIGPPIVSGPYRLIIDGTPAAYCGASHFPHLFVFDGNVSVSTQGWLFALPPGDPQYGPDDLTLRVMLSGSHVMGSIVSNGSLTTNQQGGTGPHWVIKVSRSAEGSALPVDVSGLVKADGSVTGAFDGYLGVALASYGDNSECRATFPWSLTPR
jgi:hypothetical protein